MTHGNPLKEKKKAFDVSTVHLVQNSQNIFISTFLKEKKYIFVF
jgi:hypothetical protein